MTNLEIADKIHQFAMELADLADIARIKGEKEAYLQHLKQAYTLEKVAALSLQSEPDDNEWKYLFLKSAGWLAYQLELYKEALELVELGLGGKPAGLGLYQLQELKKSISDQLSQADSKQVSDFPNSHLHGMLASADVEQGKVMVKEKDKQQLYILLASKDLIQQTARYLIGEWVEIDLSTNEEGAMVLQQIRKAA